MKRRVQAVGVVADVTVVTQQQSSWVTGLTTGFTHCTLQTAPPFGQDHPSHLETPSIQSQITKKTDQFNRSPFSSAAPLWLKAVTAAMLMELKGIPPVIRLQMTTKGSGVHTDLNVDTEGMVALSTLRTGQQSALCSLTEAATHHTHVLHTHTS